jgi:hypothetical protein
VGVGRILKFRTRRHDLWPGLTNNTCADGYLKRVLDQINSKREVNHRRHVSGRCQNRIECGGVICIAISLRSVGFDIQDLICTKIGVAVPELAFRL